MGDQQQQRQKILDDFKNNIGRIRNKVASFNTDKPKIMEALREIVIKLSNINLINDHMKQKLTEKEDEINQLKQNLQTARNDKDIIAQNIDNLTTQIKRYEEEKKNCEAKKRELENQITVLETELQDLRGQLESANNQNTQLSDNYNRLKTEFANKQTELDSLTQDHNLLVEKHNEVLLQISALNQEKQEFEKKAAAAETNLTQYVTNVNNLVSQLDEAVKSMDNDIQTNDIIDEINKINGLIEENGDNNDNNNMGLNNSPVEESKGEVPPQQQSGPRSAVELPPIPTDEEKKIYKNNIREYLNAENNKDQLESFYSTYTIEKYPHLIPAVMEYVNEVRKIGPKKSNQNTKKAMNDIFNKLWVLPEDNSLRNNMLGINQTTGGRKTRRRKGKGRRRTQRGGYLYQESGKLNKISTVVSGSNKKRGRSKLRTKYNTRKRK